MVHFAEFGARLVREDEGQDMVEYALILGLISIIAVAAIQTVGGGIGNLWNNIQTAVSGAAGGGGTP